MLWLHGHVARSSRVDCQSDGLSCGQTELQQSECGANEVFGQTAR